VKEDAEPAPLVPRRAPLPEGARNYVTPRGLALLRAELERLRAELTGREWTADVPSGEAVALRARSAELESRLASAVLVDPTEGAPSVVRFGARVRVRTADGNERSYRIVGVDEANVGEGRIAFVAPLARALLGKGVGDVAQWKTPRGDDEVEVVAIDFEQDSE
jgi:transcription elongation factor GreB